MRKILLVSLSFCFFFFGFAQKKDLDFEATLTNYLMKVGVSDKADPIRLYAIAVQKNKSEKINRLRVYYFKDGSIDFLENNSLFARFNFNDLCQYTVDKCMSNILSQEVIIPFVLKRVKAVILPRQEPLLNTIELESMIHLLRHVLKDGGTLSEPIVKFIEDPYY